MLDLKKYNCAIFDCDGVILDSNEMKSNAFFQVLNKEPQELIDLFMDYHKSNGGVSRYVKFLHYYQNIKKSENYEILAGEAVKKYAELSKEGLINCEEMPGIRMLLDNMFRKKIPCFVISGGDENEVKFVFKTREFLYYFKKILGSPADKIENMEKLKKNNELRFPGVFFGDAFSDLNAAEKYGLHFIYVASKSEWKQGREESRKRGHVILENFSDLF